MNLGKLTKEEFEYLLTSLDSNKGMTEEEYTALSIRHPYAVMRDDNALIFSSMKHYSLQDSTLNSFISTKFGDVTLEIDFVYKLIYNKGDFTNPHLDKKICAQTTLVLLTDNFEGGELLIDSKDVNLSTVGQFINFKGYRQTHSVNEVKEGVREVLVIMFNRKSSAI